MKRQFLLGLALFLCIMVLLAVLGFRTIGSIKEYSATIFEVSVPLLEESSKAVSHMWKSNKLVEDYLGEGSLDEMEEIKDEYDNVNEQITGSFRRLGDLMALGEEWEDNEMLEEIREQHFTYLENAGALMDLDLKSARLGQEPEPARMDSLEESMANSHSRIISYLEEISREAYRLNMKLEGRLEDDIASLRMILAMALAVSILFLAFAMFSAYYWAMSFRKSVHASWQRIININKELQSQDSFPSRKWSLLSNEIASLEKGLSAWGNPSRARGASLNLEFDERQVFDYISSQEQWGRSVSFKDIKNHFSITFPTVKKRVSSLEGKGLVKVEKSGRNKYVSLASIRP